MHPRQAAAASACRRVEHEIVRAWRTRMTTDEACSDLRRRRRNLYHPYPANERAQAWR